MRPKEGIPISAIVPKLRFAAEQRLHKNLRRCRQAGLRLR
jgi:hypothetical protein